MSVRYWIAVTVFFIASATFVIVKDDCGLFSDAACGKANTNDLQDQVNNIGNRISQLDLEVTELGDQITNLTVSGGNGSGQGSDGSGSGTTGTIGATTSSSSSTTTVNKTVVQSAYNLSDLDDRYVNVDNGVVDENISFDQPLDLISGNGRIYTQSGKNLNIRLGDNAGSNKLNVQDKSGTTQFSVNSDGDTTINGTTTLGDDVSVASGNYTFTATNSPIRWSGTDYYIPADLAIIWAIYKGSGSYGDMGSWDITFINDGDPDGTSVTGLTQATTSVNQYLVDAYDDDTTRLTMFSDESWANAKQLLDTLSGGSGVADDSYSGAWTYSGGGSFTYNPYSPTYTVASGFTSPPSLTSVADYSITFDASEGDGTFTGDLDVEGQLNIGAGAILPISESAVNGSLVNSTTSGTVAGLNFFIQNNPSSDSTASLYGTFTGIELRGDVNYNGGYVGSFVQTRLNSGTINGATGVWSAATLAENADSSSGYVSAFNAGVMEENTNTASITSFVAYNTMPVSLTQGGSLQYYYGLYLYDNSAAVSGQSWGIYNLDRTYLAKNVGVGTNNPQSLLQIEGGYLQVDDNNGAPDGSDCDDDSERGRMIVDYSNNRLYTCNGSARGWDYIPLTD